MRLFVAALLVIATATIVVAHRRCRQCTDVKPWDVMRLCYRYPTWCPPGMFCPPPPPPQCPGNEKYCYEKRTRDINTGIETVTMGCVSNCPKGKQGCKGNKNTQTCYYCRPAYP